MALPLSFVVLISMFKDAFEDIKRHNSDNEENTSKSEVYDVANKQFQK